jgi:hypothetical protein
VRRDIARLSTVLRAKQLQGPQEQATAPVAQRPEGVPERQRSGRGGRSK